MKKDIDEYLLTVLEKGDTFYHYTDYSQGTAPPIA